MHALRAMDVGYGFHVNDCKGFHLYATWLGSCKIPPSQHKPPNEMKHIDALKFRLHIEKTCLSLAKSKKEKELRKVWIAQIEKEIASESQFVECKEMTVDELAAELTKKD